MVSLDCVDLELEVGHGDDGFLELFVNGSLDEGRYAVVEKLGLGSYAVVWKCWDSVDARFVAIKVGRCGADYHAALLDEAERLGGTDGARVAAPVALRVFEHVSPFGTHVCIVLPLRGPTLESVLHLLFEHKTVLPLDIWLRWTKELAADLQTLHDRGFVHTDLKPDNVLLSNPIVLPRTISDPRQLGLDPHSDMMLELARARLHGLQDAKVLRRVKKRIARLLASKAHGTRDPSCFRVDTVRTDIKTLTASLRTCSVMLCDLSNAVHVTDIRDDFKKYNATQYRCPEVLLWLPFSTQSDLWSLGCLLFDMATNDVLFKPCKDPKGRYSRDDDHVAQIVELIGEPPIDIRLEHEAASCDGKVKYFFKPLGSAGSPMLRIEQLTRADIATVVESYECDSTRASIVQSLLNTVLRWDPSERSLERLTAAADAVQTTAARRIQSAWRTVRTRRRVRLSTLTSMWEYLVTQYEVMLRCLRLFESVCDDPSWTVQDSPFYVWMQRHSPLLDRIEKRLRALGWSSPVVDLTADDDPPFFDALTLWRVETGLQGMMRGPLYAS